MDEKKLIKIPVSDMLAVYKISGEGQVSFTVVPNGERELFFDKAGADPLVQISCTGDASSIGFSAGETRHNSALTMSMKYVSQDITDTDAEKKIETVVESPAGIRAVHTVV